ncbi:MAG: dicarboxylate/amino acid:cation symporter [Verrucomicrobia bacterium]|nr:dicarboxylate/amino acid:cation symporter [Verrucomicrobiota bacterium]
MNINPLQWSLHWQILFSLTLAAIIALIILPLGDLASAKFVLQTAQFFGDLFMNALKMMIIPLIVTSMVSGMLQLGTSTGIGSISLKTILYYTLSGLLAVLLGIFLVNLIQPGDVDRSVAQALLGEASQVTVSSGLIDAVEGKDQSDLIDIFKRMLPTNIFKAASDNGQLLGVILFSILFGFFAGRLPDNLQSVQKQFWESFQAVILKLTEWIIGFAPIGVFGLVLPVLYNAPIGDLIHTLSAFFLTVFLGLLIHLVIVLSILIKLFTQVNPFTHLKAMLPVLLTAFSTASSSATLPLTMDVVKEKANVSNRTSAFTLPLGATINMDGTALYECIVVLFISQLYASIGGVDLTIAQQCLVVFLALTTSIGVAGIPSASLVAISIILPAVGLPVEAIGVIWVTDRILDMCRTSVNVYSDTVAAIIIDNSEGGSPYSLELEKTEPTA